MGCGASKPKDVEDGTKAAATRAEDVALQEQQPTPAPTAEAAKPAPASPKPEPASPKPAPASPTPATPAPTPPVAATSEPSVSEADLTKSGFLRKNHLGKDFSKKNNVRYFVSEGYYVVYYKAEDKSSRCGRFDLRNVTVMKPTSGSGITQGLEMTVKQKEGDFIVSFDDAPEERDAWLKLWASAVDEKALDPSFVPFRDAALAKKFGEIYHGQSGLGRSEDTLARGSSNESPAVPPVTPPPPPGKDAGEGSDLVVEVPAGVNPGDKLRVTAPNGAKMLITVPEGAQPGCQLEFALPKSLASPKPASPAKVDAAAEDQAAVVMQSAARGQKARWDQQEQRRLEWFYHFLSPEMKQFDEALKLAASQEEIEMVDDAKQEHARQQWVAYYVSNGKYKEAHEFGWDGKNPPRKADKAAPFALCKCLGPKEAAAALPPPPPTVEDKAATALQAAVRGRNARFDNEEGRRLVWFEWYLSKEMVEEAKAIAITPEEVAQVEALEKDKPLNDAAVAMQKAMRGKKAREDLNEKGRLEWLAWYKAEGNWEGALGVAVTPEEEEEIKLLQAAATVPKADEHVTKLQSAARGHAARNAAAEKGRQEWLAWYIEMGQFADATAICITPEEEAAVTAAALEAERGKSVFAKCFSAAAPVAPEVEEQRRLAWLEFYTKEGDEKQALALCVTAEEEAAVTAAKVEQEESARLAWLEFYTKKGDKKQALALAVSKEEEAAAVESMRLGKMEAYRAAGKINDAVALAKTTEEAAAVGEPARKEWLAHYTANCDEKRALEMCVSAAEEEEVKAAVAAEEESRRLEWKAYHVSRGERKAALAYTVNDAEVAQVDADLDAAEEARRLEWRKYYIAQGDAARALQMCVSKEEEAELDAIQEGRRLEWRQHYIDEGECELALSMCVTQEEAAAVYASEEKRRVAWMEYETAEGQFKAALKMTVAPEEVAAIEAVQKAKSEAKRLEALAKHIAEGEDAKALALCVSEEDNNRVLRSQEERRQLWLEHFKATGKLAEARKLATTDAEEEELDELDRKEWLRYHLGRGEIAEAREMVVTAEEEATVDALAHQKRMGAFGLALARDDFKTAGKLAGGEAALVQKVEEAQEAKRTAQMAQLYASGQMKKAKALATSAAEVDALDEKARLEWMAFLAEQNDVEGALGMAVSEEERAAITAEAEPNRNKLRYSLLRRGKLAEALKVCATDAETAALAETIRLMWLDYYIEQGETAKALALQTGSEDMKKIEAGRKKRIEALVKGNKMAAARALCINKGELDALEEKAQLARAEAAAAAQAAAAAHEEVEEKRRLEWLQHYMDTMDLAEAQKLTVTPEEEDKVEEMARVFWMDKYLAVGQFEKASELAVTEAEHAEIEATSKDEAKQRALKLKAATAAGEFDLAATFAVTPAETEALQAAIATKRAEAAGRGDATALALCATSSEHNETHYALQESARTQWLKYYTTKGEASKALALCVSAEEMEGVRSEIRADEERRRIEWLEHYEGRGMWAEAAKLVVSAAEAEQLDEIKGRDVALQIRSYAKDATVKAALASLIEAAKEPARHAAFVAAIQTYDWQTAKAKASGAEEEKDLEDSMLRYEAMQAYKEAGDTEKALELAISQDEVNEINAFGKPKA